ncbi:MAG: class I SAM-dependent methyltransferase [Verrucomicrobia bacterium]|nr:class I SAM-dependent methyltransferase [Verrucomicrobiota bacterium]
MPSARTESAVEQRTIQVLNEIFAGCPVDRVAVRLWDGTAWPDGQKRAATLALKHPGALSRMFLPGSEVGLAEAYLRDDFDVEGDMEAAFSIADFLLTRVRDWRTQLKLAGALLSLPNDGSTLRTVAGRLLPDLRGRRYSHERDRQDVTFHYDVSNDFYRLWLDPRMVYSCAYFQSAGDDLEQAQRRKLDYLCRKLRLHPGQRLLDIGCGWGGLVLHAARQYGVRALGITLSRPQMDWARARIAEAKLENQVSVELRDYREIRADREEPYDAIVSVGMAEHVGREQLADYFGLALGALKPGGVFLNHAIGAATLAAARHPRRNEFIDRYVFPDGDIPPVPVLLNAAESAGFEIRDVENLREHYALTLRHWVRRLEARHAEALSFVNEPTYRTWRLYMAGSAHGFRRGQLGIYQTLLAKPDGQGNAHLPLTRDDWYAYKPSGTFG